MQDFKEMKKELKAAMDIAETQAEDSMFEKVYEIEYYKVYRFRMAVVSLAVEWVVLIWDTRTDEVAWSSRHKYSHAMTMINGNANPVIEALDKSVEKAAKWAHDKIMDGEVDDIILKD